MLAESTASSRSNESCWGIPGSDPTGPIIDSGYPYECLLRAYLLGGYAVVLHRNDGGRCTHEVSKRTLLYPADDCSAQRTRRHHCRGSRRRSSPTEVQRRRVDAVCRRRQLAIRRKPPPRMPVDCTVVGATPISTPRTHCGRSISGRAPGSALQYPPAFFAASDRLAVPFQRPSVRRSVAEPAASRAMMRLGIGISQRSMLGRGDSQRTTSVGPSLVGSGNRPRSLQCEATRE